jgi:hypothetical protein
MPDITIVKASRHNERDAGGAEARIEIRNWKFAGLPAEYFCWVGLVLSSWTATIRAPGQDACLDALGNVSLPLYDLVAT